MKKYSKKIALILALSLVLAIAIPALATDTVITGNYKAPEIKVILPGSQSAIINPYGLPVDIMNGTTVVATVEDSQIVTTTPLSGYNYGKVSLDIGASVVGETKGDFRLATEAPAADNTMKTGLVYFEVKTAANTLGYTVGKDTAPTFIKGMDVKEVVDALNGWTSTAFTGEGAKNQILVGARAVTKNNMATIKEADSNGDPQSGSFFIARLVGDIVKSPRDPWAATDGVEVTISWILEPTPKP